MAKGIRLSEGLLLAMFPVLGVAVVAFHQLGRHMFYGVPLELFELDTAKIILSAAPFGLYSLASLFSVSILYNGAVRPSTKGLLSHLLLATFVTAPFWAGSVGIRREPSWPTIAFIAFFALSTWGTEHFWRKLTAKSRTDVGSRIEATAGIALAAGVLILGAASVHGSILAKDQVRRTFISGTNLIVVLKSGDLLVTTAYDPETRTLVADSTTLVPISGNTVLVTRKAPVD